MNKEEAISYPRLVSWFYNDGTSIFSKQKSKERLTKIYINDAAGEELLKNGRIAALTSSGLYTRVKDPYFYVTSEEGYTTRARKHGKLKLDMRDKYPELENALTSIKASVMDYGDYIFLNLRFLDNMVNSMTENNHKFHSKHLVHKKYFNKVFVEELINYRPRALMGGVISSYQKEQLPKFLTELKMKFPNMYKEILSESEYLANFDEGITFVGKEAKLRSLNAGDVEVRVSFLDSETFYWNGKTLTNKKEIRAGEIISQVIDPKEEMVVKIIDDCVINENVELID